MLVVVAVLTSKGIFYRPLWAAVYAARVEKVCRYDMNRLDFCAVIFVVFMLVRHQQDSQVIWTLEVVVPSIWNQIACELL